MELGATWRDEVVAWVLRAPSSAARRVSDELDALVARFGLATTFVPPLVLAYGAHLLGERGAAPADIARSIGGRVARGAPGRASFARRGVLHYADSRVHLAEPIRRMLDGLPPMTGALVGTPGEIAMLGPCSIVAPDDADLHALARTLVPRAAGAILVGGVGDGDRDPARPRGARAPRRTARARAHRALCAADEPAILVVPDAATAEQLGIPTL